MLITAIFLMLTAYSFGIPTQVEKEIVHQTIEQKVTFSHSVVPKESILYPNPKPLINEVEKYFIQIIDVFTIGVKADIVSNPQVPVEGTSIIVLKLRAQDENVDLWSRDYILSPEAKFNGTGTFSVNDDTFIVPLKTMLEFIKQVEAETGMRPKNGYKLDINPVIKAKAQNKELSNDFKPSFSFSLSQNRISSKSELKQENTVSLTDTEVLSGYINVLSYQVLVVYVRYTFILLTLLGMGVAIWLFRFYRRNKPPVPEAQAINRRYRSRIIAAQNSLVNHDMSLIHMQSFKELLKLADESDKSIIRIYEDSNNTYRYFVPEGKTLYSYLASNEVPDKRDVPPPSATKEHVISDGTTE